ncbi:liver carboxylesterase 1 isoform 3-T7 [Hipposideros larvatus]
MVMVWIPGGAFQTGSASVFDGSALAAYEDVLVVTTQYRLGILGFFNTGDQYAPGNWAFMDQLAALTWVQENIESFGGDPRSVTIFGESAGAISVSSIVLSPLANGLFQKAIMESGVSIIPFLKAPDEERNEDLQVIANICGCSAADSEALLQCLRAKSSQELLSINQKTKSFTQVVDGFFLPDEPLALLTRKAFNPIPSLIGVNNNECGYVLPLKEIPQVLGGTNKSLALHLIHTILHIPTQYLHLLADTYFRNKHSQFEIRNRFLDLLGDVFFVVPGLVTARYHRDAGAPVYFYEFRHRPRCFNDTKPAFVKADHSDEVRFVFGGAFLKGDIVMFEGATEEEKLLSRKMMRYWANFARTGCLHLREPLDLWELVSRTLGHPPSPPVVDTVQGKVLGKYASLEGFAQPVAVFLGVPFAKPPLGSLRFAPPQPAEPWHSVKNTTSYPPMCSQDAVMGQVISELLTNTKENIPITFSEDCLYLNIYTPADLTKKSRLPVMVWIHGGGLIVGGASTYNGQVLAAHENVVVVTIQYRLGIWGFFSTGDEHSRGNWGVLDQVAALRWVQENIANFGGNPGSVTIFGESAGGESVSVLVLSPLAKNLFHRAISESGVVGAGGMIKENTKAIAQQIAVFAGCKTTTSAVMVHCLRQKSEDELLETSLKMKFFSLDLLGDPRENHVFMPIVVDGVVLPKMPEAILAEKKFNNVPYIIGLNKKEFGWILPMFLGYPLREDKLDQKTATWFLWMSYPITGVPEELTPIAIEKFLGRTDDPAKKKDLFLDLMGDVIFGVPSVTVARHHRDAGAPTYMYEFQYRPSFSSDKKPMTVIGDHGDELYSVFGAPFLKDGASEEETKLSKMVMKFWANFARNGNPNGEGLPHWPAYNQKEGYLQIGVTTQAAYKLKDEEVAFWTELFSKETTKKPPQTVHVDL